MGEKQFLPVQYRDPVLATKMPEHGVQVELEDDGSMLSMHPAVRYPDGRVEVVEQALSGPPPDSSHDRLDELVELPGTGDLEFVRKTLELIAEECVERLRTTDGRDAELLRDVVRCAEAAREKVLDTSISVTRYITHCMEQEDEQRQQGGAT